MKGFVLVEILVVIIIAAILLAGSVQMAQRHAAEMVWQRWFEEIEMVVFRIETFMQARASRSQLLGAQVADRFQIRMEPGDDLMLEYIELSEGEKVYEEIIEEQTGTLELLGDPVAWEWRLPFERPQIEDLEFRKKGTTWKKAFHISLPPF